MQSLRRKARRGRAQGPHGIRTKRSPLKRQLEGARSLATSPPSRMLRLPSGGWHQATPDRARSTCAIATRKHIAELRCKEPEISIDIRWCPSHCEFEGSEKADEWGQSWQPTNQTPMAWSGSATIATKTATGASVCTPHLKREFSLKRSGRMPAGGPGLSWSGPRTASTGPAANRTVARANKRLASRFFPTQGRTLPPRPMPPADYEKARRQMLVMPVQDPDPQTSLQELPAVEEPAADSWATVLEETRKHPCPVRIGDRTKIAELFAAILDFLATPDVGKTGGSGGRRSRQ